MLMGQMKREEARSIYNNLILTSSEEQVLKEAYRQSIKFEVTTLHPNTCLVDENFEHGHIGHGYGSSRNFDCSQYSVDTRRQHQVINVELAHSYMNEAAEIERREGPKKNEGFFEKIGYGSYLFGSGTQEYAEALCISHLMIASDLRDAASSFQLAKIYMANKYLLAYSYDQEKADEKALEYAIKAVEQGDKDALFNLGKLYEKNSDIFGNNFNALRCFELASQRQNGQACLALAKLCYTPILADHKKIDECLKNVFQSDDEDAKLAFGEWLLSRSMVYTDANETSQAEILLSGIAQVSDTYPEMRKLFETLCKSQKNLAINI
jgi:hypothetical protein